MEQYTRWIDDQIGAIVENVDHPVDQEGVQGNEGSDGPLNDKDSTDNSPSNIYD